MPRPLTTTEPCIYVCATCGSDKVACNARAVWNVPSQEWVSSTVFFEASCRVCQKPCRLDCVPLREYTLPKIVRDPPYDNTPDEINDDSEQADPRETERY